MRHVTRNLTADGYRVVQDACKHGSAHAMHRFGIGRTTINYYFHTAYRWAGIPGNSRGKMGQVCYRIGRNELEAEKR